ncbi:hypothetical protein RZS08_32690, partial [Arthrospira platensis SPKY1]|nr:hypothetical protein [Arthrospira platensis SPKY1]
RRRGGGREPVRQRPAGTGGSPGRRGAGGRTARGRRRAVGHHPRRCRLFQCARRGGLRATGFGPGLSRYPHGQPAQAFFDRTAFAHDADNDRLICPAGKELKPQATPHDGAVVYAASKADCRVCP